MDDEIDLEKNYSDSCDDVQYNNGECYRIEFEVRARYVREHEQLSKEEKKTIMTKCDWKKMSLKEMKELKQLDALDSDTLISACFAALEQKEQEHLSLIKKLKDDKDEMKEKDQKCLS